MRPKHYVTLCFISFFFAGFINQLQAQTCATLPSRQGITSGKLQTSNCSQVSPDINYRLTFQTPTAVGPTYRVTFDWGDGSPITNVIVPGGQTVYDVTRNHVFPLNSDCEYRVQIYFSVNAARCTNHNQEQFVTSWRTDEYNGGNVRLISPTTNTNIHEVCEGVNVDVIFQDQTIFNCNATYAANYPPNNAIQDPNQQTRWQQLIYNTPIATPRIPNVSVNGVLMAAAAGSNYADPRGRYYMATPVMAATPAKRNALRITAPGGFGAGFPTVGQEFEVTIRYWNVCNPYTNNPDPTQPPMNGDLVNGDNAPVERIALIRIIAAPAKPVVPDRTICATDSRTLTVTSPLTPAANWVYKWYSDAALTNQVGTGTTFTPGDGTAAGQIQAGQRKHWWVTVEAVAAGSCKSEATEVTLTRRTALSTPAISGPQNLCPGTTGYAYTVTTLPSNVTITDVNTGGTFDLTTEYNWVVPAGVGTITAGQGTATITVTANAAAGGSGNITAVRRYADGTPACGTNTQSRSVTVRARPTAGITPNPADVCQGAALTLNGNPVTGFGTITGHQWSGATSVLDADNIQSPTVDTNTPGTYALSYVTTATLEAGVTCSSASVNRTVNISASPTTASVGANQSHCGTLTSNGLGGSSPAPGTGTWTKQSGPGTVTFNSGANTANTTATVSQVGVYVLRWSVVNGSCNSFAELTVDFGADPGTPDAGSNNEFCGFAGSLNAVAPPTGTNIVWTQFSGPAGGSTVFSATNIRNPTITVNVYGLYTYRYTISSGTCTPKTADVQIEFFPPAIVQNVADFSTCVDAAVLAPIPLSGTFGGGAANAHWERVSGSGTFTSNGTNIGAPDNSSPATDSYTPSAGDFTTGSVQLRLVTNDPPGACPSVNDLVTITFDKRPSVINAGTDFPVCAQPTGPHTAVLAATPPNNAGKGSWSGPAGVSFGNAASPTSTVSGLSVGPNTLTWTVNSDQGLCGAQTDQVIVTVNPLPTSNAISPIVCEDILHVNGSTSVGTGQATNVSLTQFSAALADIPGAPVEVPPGVEVLYFNSAADRTAGTPQIIAPVTITAGKQIFTRTRVIATGCFTDRTITFTVRTQPVPTNFTVQVCEDNPPGSLVASGINLTSYENNVTGGIANRDVEWYTDAALTALISAGALPNQEQNYSISANTKLFAKIIDTTPGTPGCHSIAELNLQYQPRPNANTIRDGAGVAIGSTLTVCASNNLVFLQIDPTINPGSTYTWNVPAPPASPSDPGYFELLTGTNGFFIILRFPSLIPNPGLPISVTERLGTANCAGTTINTSIIVEGSPPAPVITGPATVCANSPVTYSVPFVSGDTYSWTVPPGATITSFPITNTISVQMSTFSGNVTVTVANSTGCVAPPSTPLGVTVITRPAMTSGPSNTICSGQAPSDVHTLTASLGGTTYRWEVISILGFVNGANVGDTDGSVLGSNTPGAANIDGRTLSNTSGVDAAVIYRVIPVSPPTSGVYCEGNQQNVTITIRPEPNLLLTPKTICSDEPANYEIRLSTPGLPVGTQFSWGVPVMSDGSTQGTAGTNVAAGPSGTIHINNAFLNTSPAAITATYTITAASGAGCSSRQPVASRQVVITINPKPLISTTLNKAVCSDEPIALTLNTAPGTVTASNYTIVSQTIAGLLTPHAGNALVPQSNVAANYLIGDQFTNTSGGALLVTYTVNARGSIGTCQGPDQVITLTINTGPATNSVTDEVCSDVAGGNTHIENLVALQPLVNANGTLTFEWYSDAAATSSIATPASYPLQNGVPVYVKVHNGAGTCAKIQPVEYVVNPTPAVTASVTSNYSGFSVRCIGSADGAITANPATLGTANYTYSIDGSNFFTGRIFNGLAFANNPFVVTVRDAKGCTAVSTPMSLTEPPVMTANNVVTSPALPTHHGRDLTCPGASDGQITVTAGGGTGSGYSYRIIETNATNTTGVFNGLPQGAYTVIVTDKTPNNCTITSNQVTITPPPAIVASATMSDAASCNGASDGQITAVASGGTLVAPVPPNNYTFTISPGGASNNTGIFSGLASSAVPYTISVRDDNGCTVQSNGVVVTQPAAISAFISVNTGLYPGGSAISCFGANDAELNVTANGGNGGYAYVLNVVTPGAANPSGNVNGTYTGVHPGAYTATVTDARGCNITSGQVTVAQPADINVQQFITNAISCNGDADGQIRLVATGGTGAYTYTRTAGPPLPSLPEANGTGIFSGLSEFNYPFDVRDINGCTKSLSVVLTDPDPVVLSFVVQTPHNGAQISCPTSKDGIVQLSTIGGNSNFTYTITSPVLAPPNVTGSTSGIFNGLGAGTYTFHVADPKGCEDSEDVTITPPTPVTISVPTKITYNGQDVSCTNLTDGAITVTAGGGTPSPVSPPPAYTYVLSPSSNNSGFGTGQFTNVGPGTYTITTFDANGCSATSTSITINPYAAINFPGAALVQYNGREISCNGATDGRINSTPSGGAGGWNNFTISPTPGTAVNGGNGVFTSLPAGTYVISARDANACPASTASIIVNQPDVLVASAAVQLGLTCFNSSDASVRASAVGGTVNYTFSINTTPSATVSPAVPSQHTFTGLGPNAGYIVTVTDVNGCTDDVTVAPITAPSQPVISASVTSRNIAAYHNQDITCFGANDAIITALHQSGTGTGSLTYALTGNTSGQFTGVFTQVGPGLATITATDINGCAAVPVDVPVTEPAQLQAVLSSGTNFGGFDIRCFNQTDGIIIITPAGGTGDPYSSDFQYVLMQSPASSPVITPASPGPGDVRFTNLRAMQYQARVRDLNGCTIITTPPFELFQPAQINLEAEVTSNYGVDGTDISCAGANDGIIEVKPAIAGGVGRTGGGAGSGLNDYIYVINPAENTTGAADGRFTSLKPNVLYSITATDANNCTATAFPVIMFEPTALFAGFVGSSHNICIDQANKTTQPFTELQGAFGGNGSYEYRWMQSTVANPVWPADYTPAGSTVTTFTAPTTLAQTTTYVREVRTTSATSALSCPTVASNTVTITVNPRPTVTITPVSPICQGSPLGLDFNFTGAVPFTFDYNTLETGSVTPTPFNNQVAGATRKIFINSFQEETTFTVTRVVDRNECEALPITMAPPHHMAQYTVPIVKIVADFAITSPNPQCSGETFSFSYTPDPGVSYNFQWPDGTNDVVAPGTGTIDKVLTSLNTSSNTQLPVILTATHTSCPPITTAQLVTIYPAIIINVIPSAIRVCSDNAGRPSPIIITNNTLGGQSHSWTLNQINPGPSTTIESDPNNPTASNKTYRIVNTTSQNPAEYEVLYNVQNDAARGSCVQNTSFSVFVYREAIAEIGEPAIGVWPGGSYTPSTPFMNNTNPYDPTNFDYQWTFSNNHPNTPPVNVNGNTNEGGVKDPFYTFNNPGTGKRAILNVKNRQAELDGVGGGCPSRDEFIFTITVPPLNASFTASDPACLQTAGATITVVNTSTGGNLAGADFVSEWEVRDHNNGVVYQSNLRNPTFPMTTAGRYSIYLTVRNPDDATTPSTFGPIVVDIFPNPQAAFITSPLNMVFVPDQELRTDNRSSSPLDPITLTPYPIRYTWDFDDGSPLIVSGINPIANDPNSGHSPTHRYTVADPDILIRLVAINDHGTLMCTSEATQAMQARAAGTSKVPNAFTPSLGGPNGGIVNEDGTTINDVFLPITKGIKEFQMQIFDRWGNLVFESRQQNRGWDGYDRNGNLMPAGVYVYKLVLRMANDQRTTQVGDVTLIR